MRHIYLLLSSYLTYKCFKLWFTFIYNYENPTEFLIVNPLKFCFDGTLRPLIKVQYIPGHMNSNHFIRWTINQQNYIYNNYTSCIYHPILFNAIKEPYQINIDSSTKHYDPYECHWPLSRFFVKSFYFSIGFKVTLMNK